MIVHANRNTQLCVTRHESVVLDGTFSFMKQTTVDDSCKSSFSEELIYFKFVLGNKSA